MNSFFYHKLVNFNGRFNYDGVQKWTKRIDIFCSNQIFFPININREHWALVCVSMLSKKIKYFDSLGTDGTRISRNILKWPEQESVSRTQKPISGFSMENIRCPLQSNGFDCGVFTLGFADLLANDLPVEIMQQSLCENIRLALCVWIVRGIMVLLLY